MPTSGHLEDYIDGLTEETSPDSSNDMLLIRDDTDGSIKKISPSNLASGASGIAANGWEAAGETWAYASADDPTFTFTIAADVTTKYSAGMRVRLSQSTGGTKYFIITKVAESGGTTTITVYGGTDYNLENEAISSPNYSVVKAPFGFPLDPTKWTVEVSDTTLRSQATPTANTWYNLGTTAAQISIPIGVWRTSYDVSAQWGNGASPDHYTTLSTGSASESDVDFTARTQASNLGGAGAIQITVRREKVLALTSKTLYYLNTKTATGGAGTTIFNRNDVSKMFIRAVCAYL